MAAKRKHRKKPTNFSSIMVSVLTAFLIAFTTACMVAVFVKKCLPDTLDMLIIFVFSFCTGECGLMAWIKTSKMRNGVEEAPTDAPDTGLASTTKLLNQLVEEYGTAVAKRVFAQATEKATSANAGNAPAEGSNTSTDCADSEDEA